MNRPWKLLLVLALGVSTLGCSSSKYEKICKKTAELRGKEVSGAELEACVVASKVREQKRPKRFACVEKCLGSSSTEPEMRACYKANCRRKSAGGRTYQRGKRKRIIICLEACTQMAKGSPERKSCIRACARAAAAN